MAKKKAKRHWYSRKGKHRKTSKRIPLLPLVTGVAPVFMAYSKLGGTPESLFFNPQETLRQIAFEYSGYDINTGGWHSDIFMRNIGMWIAGAAGHYIANKAGVNRAIARIPFIGKYVGV